METASSLAFKMIVEGSEVTKLMEVIFLTYIERLLFAPIHQFAMMLRYKEYFLIFKLEKQLLN